jgi:hypothetical protein
LRPPSGAKTDGAKLLIELKGVRDYKIAAAK